MDNVEAVEGRTETCRHLSDIETQVLHVLSSKRLVNQMPLRSIASAIDRTAAGTKKALDRLYELGFIRGIQIIGNPIHYKITSPGRQAFLSEIRRRTGGKTFTKDFIMKGDEVSDDRPAIGGHPLPWSIVPYVKPPAKRPEADEDGDDPDEEVAAAFIVDADGYQIRRFTVDSSEGKLWPSVVEHLAKKPETMFDLALAEKAAKVAKIRLENDRASGVEGRRIAALENALVKLARTYLPKTPYEMNDCDRKARNVLTELGLGTLIWTPEASS